MGLRYVRKLRGRIVSVDTISVQQMAESVGTERVSDWVEVSQTMIDQFAEATGDHQFIHVDPARAAATPFGGTIAHGFLLLSLLSAMTFETLPPLEGSGMGINHGFDKVRFIAPVKSGARIRARFALAEANARPSGWVQVSYDVTIEVEMKDGRGARRTALMPVMRFPNFTDKTGDVAIDRIWIPVGNQVQDGGKPGPLTHVTLKDFLADPTRYLSLPGTEKGRIRGNTLLARRDSHALVMTESDT